MKYTITICAANEYNLNHQMRLMKYKGFKCGDATYQVDNLWFVLMVIEGPLHLPE